MLTSLHQTRRTLRKATRAVRIEPLEDRRLLSAGQLDSTFGTGGLTDIDYHAVDSVVLPDGKILTAASVSIPQTGSAPIEAVMVTRFNPNGTPDTTFGGSGQSTKIINDNQDESLRAIDLAVQSDGK